MGKNKLAKEQWIHAYKSGMKIPDIARFYNARYNTVLRTLDRAGVKPKKQYPVKEKTEEPDKFTGQRYKDTRRVRHIMVHGKWYSDLTDFFNETEV